MDFKRGAVRTACLNDLKDRGLGLINDEAELCFSTMNCERAMKLTPRRSRGYTISRFHSSLTFATLNRLSNLFRLV